MDQTKTPNQQPQDVQLIVTLTTSQLRQLVREEVKAASTGSPEKLLTPDQLAEALGVPLSWVYEKSRQGEIPTIKTGHYSRFDLAEVLACLKKN